MVRFTRWSCSELPGESGWLDFGAEAGNLFLEECRGEIKAKRVDAKRREEQMVVTFHPPKRDGKILAFADVMVADGITVCGFRVVDGDNGLFADVPSKGFQVDGTTRFYRQVIFADKELKERFLSELIDEFHRWNKVRETSADDAHSRTDVESDVSNPPF
jgi:DNA-binding cell septation regulator SpoVG